MKKIVIFAGLILLLSIIGYLLTQKQKSVAPLPLPTPRVGGNLPESQIQLPQGETIEVPGMQIKNIYKTAVDINEEGDVVFSETQDYNLMLIPKTELILVTVLGSPFEQARKSAEDQFLRSLGIDEEEACNLNVNVGTPAFANPKEAGKNYRLSFCE